MSGFLLGGRTSEQLGVVMMRSTQRPMLPPTRDYTVSIPGRNGEYDFGADMGPRLFSLECRFLTKDASDLQQRASAFAAHLVDTYGKPRTMQLQFTLRPNISYTVRYSGQLPIDRVVGMGTFTLPLIAYDPYGYGQEQIFETVITQSPEVRDIISSGDIRTEPIIVLQNIGSNTIHSFRVTNEYRLE